MDQKELSDRMQAFAVRVVRLVGALPRNREGDVLGRQLLRSGTAIGANYREACRASSRKHFISTLQVVQREADETIYWLEILGECGVVRPNLLEPMRQEANELLAIVTATLRTTKGLSDRGKAEG